MEVRGHTQPTKPASRRSRGAQLASQLSLICIMGLAVGLAPVAHAVELSAAPIGSGSYSVIRNCGIEIVGSSLLTKPLSHVEFGVAGGLSSTWVDGGEWIEVTFDQPVSGARYSVANSFNGDNDGISGRTFVEAFGAGDASLGLRIVDGDGLKEMSSLYGNTPIERILITSTADGVAIGSVAYDESGAVEIDFERSGPDNVELSQYWACNVSFGGSAKARVFNTNGLGGLGIEGGASDFITDGVERLSLSFPYPVTTLTLESLLIDFNADSEFGSASLFAYDEFGDLINGVGIGIFSPSPENQIETLDVAALFPGVPIDRIEIFSQGDGRRLDRVVYAPEPSGGLLLGTCFLAMLIRKRG